MWFLAHGIATMLVTSYFDLGMDAVSEMLTDAYVSLLPHYLNKQDHMEPAMLIRQIPILPAGAAIYALGTAAAYFIAAGRFEKVDL